MKSTPLPRDAGFLDLLRRQAEARPDAPALLWDPSKAPCTYGELLDRVTAQAETWRQTGKTCLGLLCDGSFSCVRAILSAAIAGLQVVLLDGNTPEDQLPALIQKTDIDLLWGDDVLDEDMSPWLTQGVKDGGGRVLFFTSGTTSSSRAVELSQESLCASAWNGGSLLPLDPADRLLCVLPLNHVFGFVCGLLWGLSCGACVALGRGPRYYAQDFAAFRPTAVALVPALVGFLLKQKALNPELGLVLIGAGDCPPALPRALQGLGLRVSFGYGLTETSSGVALSLGEDPYAMTLCPDYRVLLAPDGEILIPQNPCVMRGYYRDPAATRGVLYDGLLHTGDLGALDEVGRLRILGRKKEMLVFPDGTKLFLPEYEALLQAALPGRELAVIELEGAPALVLRGTEAERETVAAALEPCMRSLPLARRLKTTILDPAPLPRTATGKIQRWILKERMEKNQ